MFILFLIFIVFFLALVIVLTTGVVKNQGLQRAKEILEEHSPTTKAELRRIIDQIETDKTLKESDRHVVRKLLELQDTL